MNQESNDSKQEILENLSEEEKAEQEFKKSSIMARFFAFKRNDVKIAIFLALMFIFEIFVYSSSRLVKDNLVVGSLGAQVLPFAKLIVILMTVLVAVLYLFGITTFTRRRLFYVVLGIFASFFTLFGFVFYPYKEKFILSDGTVSNILGWLGGNTGSFFNGALFLKLIAIAYGLGLFLSINSFNFRNILKKTIISTFIVFGVYSLLYSLSSPVLATKLSLTVKLIQLWPFTCYYVLSELWGAYALNMLFWNFANHQVTLDQAKRVYPFLLLTGQIGQITAGVAIKSSIGPNLVMISTILTVIACLSVGGIHEYIFRKFTSSNPDVKVATKHKPGVLKALKAMTSSTTVLLVSLIVIFYGMTVGILETYWKIRASDVAAAMTTTKEAATAMYSSMQADSFIYIGLLAIVTALMSSYLVRRFGWLSAAIVTPSVLAVGATIFFSLDIWSGAFTSMFGIKNILLYAMHVGMIVLVFFKATKYTIFDNTKELLLVKLGAEIKSESKVADSLAGKLGKSLSAGLITSLSFATTSITGTSVRAFLFIFILLIASLWLFSVLQLGRIYNRSEKKDHEHQVHSK